jgi:hypothetical protein
MMIPGAPYNACRDPLSDVHPQTGATIEVFYWDRTLETFGRCGAGWFWWFHQRGFSPEGLATGPFICNATRRIGTLYWLQALETNLGINLIETKSTINTRRPASARRRSFMRGTMCGVRLRTQMFIRRIFDDPRWKLTSD